MKNKENRWGQSVACCCLPALFASCSTQGADALLPLRLTVPKTCSIELPSAAPIPNSLQPNSKSKYLMPAHAPLLTMPWMPMPSAVAEEFEIQTPSYIFGHLPTSQRRTSNSQQTPLWKKHGHEVSHFLGVPDLEKQEHRRLGSVASPSDWLKTLQV